MKIKWNALTDRFEAVQPVAAERTAEISGRNKKADEVALSVIAEFDQAIDKLKIEYELR